MSKLLIVESPSKAKTIQKYLGSDYEVVASMGHIRDLYPSKLSVDISNKFTPDYTIVKGKEKLVKDLKAKAKKADDVILATDPDREGEAISWHIATLLGLDLKIKNRVKFNEINSKSVIKGIENPEPIDIDLVNAQQARRILDRLVGYRLSPFISQKIHRGLSAGRVQSVALRIIVDREDEIKKFNPEEYWTIDAVLSAPPSKKYFKAQFTGDENGKIKLTDKSQTDEVLSRLENALYKVTSVKKGTKTKNPQPPFITSTLQQEASKVYNFTGKRTMKIAQELYEGIDVKEHGSMGLITYMRTDSLRISDESRQAGEDYIRQTFGEKYLPEKSRIYKAKAGAQDGHEAIRPTVITLTPEMAKPSLTPEQYKLYSLIWKRFISSLMSNYIQNTTKAEIRAIKDGDESHYCTFSATGYSVKFDGYTVLYEAKTDDDEAETVLPDFSENSVLKLKENKAEQHFTQPPARYSEATLIKKLEETGVGRPSTYASIVSLIIDREYISRDKKSLVPTELGTAITNLLKEKFSKIVNIKFTAGMESELDKIEAGGFDYIKMLDSFYSDFEATLSKAKNELQGQKITLDEDKTEVPCENCGSMMVVKVGRYGKFLACPNYPKCKTTKPFVKETPGICPVCGNSMISKKSRKGFTFYGCSGYPACSFMTWDVPLDQFCPECGKTLFKARGNIIKCLNADCNYSVSGKKSKKDNDE